MTRILIIANMSACKIDSDGNVSATHNLGTYIEYLANYYTKIFIMANIEAYNSGLSYNLKAQNVFCLAPKLSSLLSLFALSFRNNHTDLVYSHNPYASCLSILLRPFLRRSISYCGISLASTASFSNNKIKHLVFKMLLSLVAYSAHMS